MQIDHEKMEELRQEAFEAIGNNKLAINVVQKIVDSYGTYLDAVDDEMGRLRSEADECSAAEDAAHKLCDAVSRQVGKRTFTIPRQDEFDRAAIGLHDAIGRNI